MIAGAAAASAIAVAVAAPAWAEATGTVKPQTTQRMNGPALNSGQDGVYKAGEVLTLVCHTTGEPVKGFFSFNIPNGGWDNMWYKTGDGHYVADVDIETHTLGALGPACSPQAGPQAASGGSGGSVAGKVDKFVADTNGKQVGDGQCVTLIKEYLRDVYNVTPGAWGNAIDYSDGGQGGNHLQSNGFTWHTDQQFQNGDILVWKQDSHFAYLPQGHIALWHNGKIFDQNYAGRLTAGSDPFSGYGYLGHWRKT